LFQSQSKHRGDTGSAQHDIKSIKEVIDMTNLKQWMRAAGIRALRTVAQSALATVGTSAVLGDVDWLMVCSAAALAGILSILTSLTTGLPEVGDGPVC
jgi:hypothetical protein